MGNLYIVATPIGNMEDITKRALQVLVNVDIILCEDTRTSSNLLNHFNIKKKLISYHKFNEVERTTEILEKLENGLNMALITDAGTPCISDPGSILIKKAIEKKIQVYSIPGPSALVTALTLTGLKVDNFAFYGFLERKKSLQKKQLEKILENDIEILIFYESPKRIIDTLTNIQEVLFNPYLIVLNDLTKKFERKYYGFSKDVIQEIADNANHERGEYVIVVKKNRKEALKEEILKPEALLIDTVIRHNCTMKEAISLLSKSQNNYSKNELYQASIQIKKLLS